MRKEAKKAPKRNEDKVRQLSQENAIIAEIGRIISSTLNIDDVYERFAEKVRDLIPFDWIAINTINLKDNTVIAAYFTGVEVPDIHQGDPLPLTNSIAGEVLETRSGLLIQMKNKEEMIRQFPRLLGYFEVGFQSMISVPLISKDEVIGVLHLRSMGVDYTEKDLELAERVGHQIAGTITNAQLYAERMHAEEALRQSEERYRTIIENIQEGYFEVDLAGKFTFVNDSEARMLGYTKEELIGMTNRQYADEKSAKELYHLFNGVYRTGEPVKRYDLELTMKDGTKGFNEISASLIRDSEGKPIGFGGIARDVTERKRMEETLKKSEKEAKRLAQENELVAEIGRIISSTLNVEEVYDRFTEEVRKLIPFDWTSINMINRKENTQIGAYAKGVKVLDTHKKSIPLSNTITGEVMQTRSSVFIQMKGREEWVRRFPLLLKYFEVGFRSMMSVPLISKDEVIGVLHLRSMEVDYTERDLGLAERVGSQIAGAIANSQLFTERRQAEEVLERNQEELIKKNKEIEEGRQNLQLALEELEGAYKELKATQSKILQQEKMASIGQLAAGVAHEINNPMAFISSNLGTLDKYVNRLTEFIQTQSEVIGSLHTTEAIEGLKGKQKELKLDYITEDIKGLITESLDGSERVRKIVQGLKSFARVDEAEYKYADINECIESTINIVWNELKYKATLKKDYGNLPLTKCYPQQINQVFMNLLINAGHAIESQGEITIKTWAEDGSIWVAISDTGHGIPKEDLNKIFEPFFTTKEVGKGTGLGLSITYEIVQKHDGEITVESEVGKGTTFTVRLPIT
jgi:PAS domain S-box-containing protein